MRRSTLILLILFLSLSVVTCVCAKAGISSASMSTYVGFCLPHDSEH